MTPATVLLANQLLHESVALNLVIALVVVLGSVWLGTRERRPN